MDPLQHPVDHDEYTVGRKNAVVQPVRRASGRRAVLECLDRTLSEEANIQCIRNMFETMCRENTLLFMRAIVMPLMPKHMIDGQDEPEDLNELTVNFIVRSPDEQASAEAAQRQSRETDSASES